MKDEATILHSYMCEHYKSKLGDIVLVEIYDLIKIAQKDAYNSALEDAISILKEKTNHVEAIDYIKPLIKE